MKITISEPKEFISSIKAVSVLLKEALLKFSKENESISIHSMDVANICMIKFRWAGAKCEEFTLDKDYEIGVNLGELKTVLNTATNKDLSVSFYLDKKKKGEGYEDAKLNVAITGTGKKKVNKKFSLSAIEWEEKKKEQNPKLSFDATVKIDNDKLNEAITDLVKLGEKSIGQSVTLKVDKEGFKVEAAGNLTTAKMTFEEAEVEGTASCRFGIEYINKILEGSKVSERAVINIKKDYPCKIAFIIDSGCKLEYLLAPRVDND